MDKNRLQFTMLRHKLDLYRISVGYPNMLDFSKKNLFRLENDYDNFQYL